MDFIITISGPDNGARIAIANVVQAALRGEHVTVRFDEETRNHQGAPAAGSMQLAIQKFRPVVTIIERAGEPVFPAAAVAPGAAPPDAPPPPIPNPHYNPFIAIRNRVATIFRRKHASPTTRPPA